MTCWRTINLSKDYGFHRMVIVSLMTMLFTFIIFYVPLNLVHSSIKLETDGFFIFILSLLFIFPAHKILHSLPLLLAGKKISIEFSRIAEVIPIFKVSSKERIPKPLILAILLTPFLVITICMLAGCFLSPQYIHYFTIIAAVNLGFCVTDFLLIKHLIRAPKRCVVEEFKDGYDILINS